MKKIIYYISLFSMFCFTFNFAPVLGNSDQQESSSSSPHECVIFQGYGADGSGQSALKFYNACSSSVNVNVCVTEDGRKYELKRSFKRIPSGGTLQIFSFPGTMARDAYWASSPDEPPIPGPCAPNNM